MHRDIQSHGTNEIKVLVDLLQRVALLREAMQLTSTYHDYHTGQQYCVYRDCHGWSSIIAIPKEILVFTFSFNLNLSSNHIKVENM